MADQEQLERLKEGIDPWNRYVAKQIELWKSNYSNAELNGLINLGGSDLSDADLAGADLRGAFLRGSCLDNVDLCGANLSEADLSLATLEKAKMGGAHLSRANLSGADMSKSSLANANLSNADLSGASLAQADLTGADLTRADLSEAGFSLVDFSGADLSYADLTLADLSRANLSGAEIYHADLRHTNLTESRMGGTVLAAVDLSRVNGLASVKHWAASTLGLDTLALSRGQIPDLFLKGCGLADWEIENAKLYDSDLSNDEYIDIAYRVALGRSKAPIQINPVFLSYAHQDNLFVDELQKALDKKGVRSWRDRHDAEVGPLEKVIDRAIRMNPTVLLVLSEASANSGWVGWEIEKARALEKELKRPVLCPVAIDDVWQTEMRGDLRNAVKRYAVLDLSGDGAIELKMPRILKGLQIHYREGTGDGG